MGCDERTTCPKCNSFETLKLWFGEAKFNKTMTEYTLELTSFQCTKCGYSSMENKK